MTYYIQPRQSKKWLVMLQIVTTVLALFFLFSWTQERDANAELHETLAALDSECGPVIELSMPVELARRQM